MTKLAGGFCWKVGLTRRFHYVYYPADDARKQPGMRHHAPPATIMQCIKDVAYAFQPRAVLIDASARAVPRRHAGASSPFYCGVQSGRMKKCPSFTGEGLEMP